MKYQLLPSYLLLLSVCFLTSACSSSAPSSNPDTTGDSLTDMLADPDPVFVPQAELVNRTWTLTHYQYDDGIRLVVSSEQARQFTLRLVSATQPDGSNVPSINGTIACNGYDGNYVLEENVLYISNMISTDAFCDALLVPPAPLFEQVIFNTQSGTMVALENDQLVLTTDTNEKMFFTTDQNIGFSQIHSGDLAFTEDLTFNEPLYQVLRSQAQLNELYYGSLLPPCENCESQLSPLVDFSVATVVFVAHEIVPSGGYDISVNNVAPTETGVQVDVLKTSPGENCPVDSAFTGPYRLYEINGVFDEVNFVERTALSVSC